MCAILLVSSLAVLAGSNSADFGGTAYSSGTAVIVAKTGKVSAQTVPTYPSRITGISTFARTMDNVGYTTEWETGSYEAIVPASWYYTYGESHHYIAVSDTSSSKYLSCPCN